MFLYHQIFCSEEYLHSTMVVTRFHFARVSDVMPMLRTRLEPFEDHVFELMASTASALALEEAADQDVITSMHEATMILAQRPYDDESETTSRLMKAAGESMNNVLAFLLDTRNGDESLTLEHVDEDGMTVLMHAAANQNVRGIQLLVKTGAMVNAPNPHTGMTALHYASIKTVQDPCCSTIQALVDAGANVNALDNNLRSALHETCDESQPYPSLILIRNGCDIAQADNEGNTPLHLACGDCGDWEIACILLGLGANPYALRMDGTSPLHISFESDICVLKHMIEFCPTLDMNFQTRDGNTLLHLLGTDDEGFELIIKQGGSVDVLNYQGNMPIHVLAGQGCTSTIELIYQLGLFLGKSHLPGFDLETPNTAGMSPSMIAHNFNRHETVEFFSTTILSHKKAEDARRDRLVAVAMGNLEHLGTESPIFGMKEENVSMVLNLMMQDPLEVEA
jgi:ankyrin repeat protein